MASDNLRVVPLEEVVRKRVANEHVVTIKDVMLGTVVVESADGHDQKRRRKRAKKVEEKRQEIEEAHVLDGGPEENSAENVHDIEDEVVAEVLGLDEEYDEEEDEEELASARKAQLDAINKNEGLNNVQRSRKKARSNNVKTSWSFYETEMFFDNLRLSGTDFVLGAGKFPTRSHKQMVRKLLDEEKTNQKAIDWALQNPLNIPDDVNPFSVPLPCQLEGYASDDLDAYYKGRKTWFAFFFFFLSLS